MKQIHLIMETETHHKQWGAELNGSLVSTAWGRVGAEKLQSQTKSFPTPEDAEKFFNKKLKEKMAKGYVLVSKNW